MSDRILYHVNRRVTYNSYPELLVGSKVEIGSYHNPFFSVYEKERVYDVGTPDGVISCKAIRYLAAVKDGEIQSPRLPRIAHEIAQHYLILARELIMEEIRKAVAPNAPSRQACLWMTRSIADAKVWQSRLGGNSNIVAFKVDGAIHEADAGHLLGDSEPLTLTYDKARKYWLGDISETPEPELLFSGSAEVICIHH